MIDSKVVERYKFYRLCDIDFDTASHALRLLARYKRLNIRFLIIRDAIISYARPFSGNKGLSGSSMILPVKFVPKHFNDLHVELMNLRNRAIAHTDLDFIDPKVVNWSTAKGKWFPMSFKNLHNEHKRLGDNWKDILTMITSIRSNLATVSSKIEDKYFITTERQLSFVSRRGTKSE